MTPAEVIAMLTVLDTLFSLGGKLVAAAKQQHPALREPMPDIRAKVEAAEREAEAMVRDAPCPQCGRTYPWHSLDCGRLP